MATTYLEHANVTVPSITEAIKFLLTIDPNFIIRQDQSPEGNSY
jgi:hypothetical protein